MSVEIATLGYLLGIFVGWLMWGRKLRKLRSEVREVGMAMVKRQALAADIRERCEEDYRAIMEAAAKHIREHAVEKEAGKLDPGIDTLPG